VNELYNKERTVREGIYYDEPRACNEHSALSAGRPDAGGTFRILV